MRDNDLQQISPMVLVYGAIFIAAIVFTYVGFSSRNPFFVGAIALIPFGILLLNRPDIWLITIIVMLRSKVRFPGLFGQLEFVQILLCGLLCVMFAKRIIIKSPPLREGGQWKFLYLFLAVLLLTMGIRGFGFQVLGDSKLGGMRYVQLLITAFLPLTIYYVYLNPKQWRIALVGMGAMTLLPAVADSVFILSRGVIYQQYYLLQHGATVGRVVHDLSMEQGGRFGAGSSAAAGLSLIPYLVWPYRSANYWRYAAFLIPAVILAGLSGHRISILTTLAFIWVYGYSKSGRNRRGFLLQTAFLAGFFFLLAITFVNHLPFAIQRSLAWVPYLNIDEMARISAKGTLEWRLQVWVNALREVPEYLLVGKGFTYDAVLSAGLRSMSTYEALFEWPKVMVAYHNGPLSLLIGMGVAGLFAGLGFLVTANWRHLNLLAKGEWKDPSLRRLHHAITILLFVKSCSYILIYGDVYRSFPSMFVWLSILEGLWYTNRKLPDPLPTLDEDTAVDASIRPRRGHVPAVAGY